MGRKLVPKEIRDFNYTRDQLIETMQKKDALQEQLIATQSETIAELTRQLEALEGLIKQISENTQPEREPED